MIRILNAINEPTEYRGLSTDEKPKDDFVQNGDAFLEMDTGKVYLFDGSTKTWIELK